jgi:hypothetical protein
MGFIEHESQGRTRASIKASDGLHIPSIQVASRTSGSEERLGQRDI